MTWIQLERYRMSRVAQPCPNCHAPTDPDARECAVCDTKFAPPNRTMQPPTIAWRVQPRRQTTEKPA